VSTIASAQYNKAREQLKGDYRAERLEAGVWLRTASAPTIARQRGVDPAITRWVQKLGRHAATW
jgi:hypothetical protein